MIVSIDIMEPDHRELVDLAPGIYRQRLVIEGLVEDPIGPEQIEAYLTELSTHLGMRTILAPITHESEQFGWAGWIHWETSGAHFYAWERPTLFFSVDIYTCKWFPAEHAVAYTRDFFHPRALQSREF
jgi:hypothetical protein